MTRTKRAADVRSIAVSSISMIAALTLWGGMAPAVVGYLSLGEPSANDAGSVLFPIALMLVASFAVGAAWTRLVEHRPFRLGRDPDDPDEGISRRVTLIANLAGLAAMTAVTRSASYVSSTEYVGAPAGDLFQVFIPADLAHDLVLGVAAYTLVSLAAVGLLSGDGPMRQGLEPNGLGSPHS